jgi:hypothetical protein
VRFTIAFVALVALVALGGCPSPHDVHDAGPDNGVDAGPAGAVDPTTYCESIVDFYCPFYLRCGRMAVADVAACKPVFLAACNARFEPTFVSLAKAGLLELSKDGIQQCKDSLATVSCDQQIGDLDGACANMWVGQEPASAKCGFDIESLVCQPGTTCLLDVSLCGTCEPALPDGSSCSAVGAVCATTSECNATMQLCQPLKKPGEACGGDDHCVLGATCTNQICVGPSYVGPAASCDFSDRCEFDTSCVPNDANVDVCVQNAALGEACSATRPCDSAFCDGTKCVALTAQGGACTVSGQCQTGSCVGGSCSKVPSACFSP